MSIANREPSRHHGSPVKLFLFRGADPSAESLVRSINLMPGNTEFGYGTTVVYRTQTEGGTTVETQALNRMNGAAANDFIASIDEMRATFPNLEHVSLVVTWFGDDLRAGNCLVEPRVGAKGITTSPYSWQAGGLTRASAKQTTGGQDGSPADRTIYEAITVLKARGLSVTLHPMIFMDISGGNGLPDPYGLSEQAPYPWRGRVTCHPAPGMPSTVDGTAAAVTQVNAFFGDHIATNFSWDSVNLRVNFSGSGGFQYFRFILHMATIAAAAGADGILIGSSLVGLTSVRGASGTNPAVAKLKTLAARVRTIMGAGAQISYSADWTEYHSLAVSGNRLFHMDPLWSDDNISYVGVAAYFPLSDWREGKTHLDWRAGFTSLHDLNYLKSNVEGGEHYDWIYASDADRVNQVRTPLSDPFNKPWVQRAKDIVGWLTNAHYDRLAGVEQSFSTAWVPSSKQIVFTELGCGAVNKGSNLPHQSDDLRMRHPAAAVPFTTGAPDAAIQRAYIEAALDYWHPDGEHNQGVVNWNRSSVWCWDARPYPVFPSQSYSDSSAWSTGHWLNGRLMPGRGFNAGHASFGPYAFNNGETAIERAGIIYQPWPIKHSDLHSAGDLDKSDVTVTMALHNGLLGEFVAFPPSQVVNLTIFQGHVEDPATLTNYPAVWLGRVTASEVADYELSLSCAPVSSSIQRPGLRRNYQLGCPHVLYGSECRARKSAATRTRTAATVTSNNVTLVGDILAERAACIGGTLEWTRADGKREIRTITNVSADGFTLSIRGGTRGLTAGMSLSIVFGCARNMAACRDIHNNIINFGGQPFIPLDNPLSQKNNYY